MVDKKLGLVGTYKYAARKSRSLVFKSYVLISSVIGMFIVFLIYDLFLHLVPFLVLHTHNKDSFKCLGKTQLYKVIA